MKQLISKYRYFAAAIFAALPAAGIMAQDAQETPVYRPLVEEYTGLWCGSCPSGYVALEEAYDEYGRDFVAIAYHINDDIQTCAQYPPFAGGLPTALVNRKAVTSMNSIGQVWAQTREEGTDADVALEAVWTSEAKTSIRARGTVRFMTDHKGTDYRFAFVLVADGLTNRAWGQTNYYSGTLAGGKYWPIFTKGGGIIYGLKFNNVPMIAKNPSGIEHSIPSTIEAGETYAYDYEFDLADAKTWKTGAPIIQDKGMLRVIMFVLDTKTRQPLNSISSGYMSEADIMAGVGGVEEVGEIVATRFYDMQGHSLAAEPQAGTPYILVETDACGRVRTSRRMAR